MRRILAAVALIGLVGACGSDTKVAPVAGELTLSFSSPGTTDGALLVLVSGGPVTSVTALNGYRVASGAAGTNLTRIVITGNLAGGDIARLTIPNLDAAASYSARVEAAANRATFALTDPQSYTAGLRK